VSGSRVPHLQRRQGTYHLRVRVPDDLRLRIGLHEVRRSLRVHTLTEARPLPVSFKAGARWRFRSALTRGSQLGVQSSSSDLRR
jgi:hypothetical protein